MNCGFLIARCTVDLTCEIKARNPLGFEGWPKLVKHIGALTRKDSPVLEFESAVEAVVTARISPDDALWHFEHRQPQGIKTFGSTFKNPDERPRTLARTRGLTAGQLLAEAGCAGFGVGGARFSPKHANFIENTGAASTADVLAVMAEGRRRVLERFGVELEPEVQALGDLRLPRS